MTLTVANAERALKELYGKRGLAYALYEKNPVLARLPKDENFTGYTKRIPLLVAPGGGGSHTFANALANRTGGNYRGFNLDRKKDYAIFTLENEAMLASRDDKGAFVKLLESETHGAKNKIGQSLSRGIFGSGSASLGQIGSISGGDTITLTDRRNIVNFEVGMVLVSDVADGGGTVDTATATIARVNREAGTIQATAALNAEFAVNDYLFREGDYDQGMNGFASWIPSTAPTSGDSFLGLDRSVDAVRLAGFRYTATVADDETLDQAVVNLGAEMEIQEATPDVLVCHPTVYARLKNDARDRTTFEKQVVPIRIGGDEVKISYKALMFSLGTGQVEIIGDKHCRRDDMWLLQMDTWELCSLGAAPHMFVGDGNQRMLTEHNADAVQGRFMYYANLGCKMPGYNARMDISDFFS